MKEADHRRDVMAEITYYVRKFLGLWTPSHSCHCHNHATYQYYHLLWANPPRADVICECPLMAEVTCTKEIVLQSLCTAVAAASRFSPHAVTPTFKTTNRALPLKLKSPAARLAEESAPIARIMQSLDQCQTEKELTIHFLQAGLEGRRSFCSGRAVN